MTARDGDLESDGYSIVRNAFEASEVDMFLTALRGLDGADGTRSRGGVYAIRNLLGLSPVVNKLAECEKVRAMLRNVSACHAFPVRGTLFDKTEGANWLVPWHQDLTICVAERIDTQGYGPWTTKAGVCHVQPPLEVLNGMLSIRIHLDDCDEANGALRVLPGTHRLGRLTSVQIQQRRSALASFCCEVKAGDVLLMKPLLLHASSAAIRPGHRRVVHLDYATSRLAGGLEWYATRA